ncbi:hypothetical protein [Pseudoalteromonas sp. A601]|uniref:hypothetical protein n=1 Tax=Pseudoalteromonas sp. A601 TaxID=1967839 RepID=UPI001C3D30C6|nr:hypothetical protein [Pseudoalteromonas sp. A601]
MSQIDLMTTIAAIIDFSLPDDAAEDSFNLLQLWTGQSAKSPRHALVHNTTTGKFAIRSNDWTLIDVPSGNQNGNLARFNYADWQKTWL